MKKRKGIYIVKTHVWYVERLVWLVAGTDVVASSILTAYVNPNWAFSILFVGICSLMVAFTGFCIVGNILVLLGAKPMIPSTAIRGAIKDNGYYFMQTDRWFLERYIYLFVGFNLSWTSLFARFHSFNWLFFTGFVGSATIVFAFTGFCIMANLLFRLGAEPRLCRNL